MRTDPRQLPLLGTGDVVDVPATAALALPPLLSSRELHTELPARTAVDAYLGGLDSKKSRRVMASYLETVAALAAGPQLRAREVPWHQLRAHHIDALRPRILERYEARSSCNLALAALRGVLRESWRAGWIPTDEYQRVNEKLGQVRGRDEPGRAATLEEVRAIFWAAARPGGALALRDGALVALLYGAGLRREEACAADLGDFDRTTGELLVHGKGKRERRMPLGDVVRVALDRWIERRGTAAGPLLLPIHRGGSIRWRRLAPNTVYDRVGALRQLATERMRTLGQLGPDDSLRLRPHLLRHSFATHLLDKGASLAVVGDLLGHESLETTRRYAHQGDAGKRSAVDLLDVPYEPPAET